MIQFLKRLFSLKGERNVGSNAMVKAHSKMGVRVIRANGSIEDLGVQSEGEVFVPASLFEEG